MGTVAYDAEDDILYVRLRAGDVHHSVSVDDLRIIDYTDDNAVVGIEFIGASGRLDLRDIPFAPTVEALIREDGLSLPIFA